MNANAMNQLQPSVFDCALMLLEDSCPPEKHMQLCLLQEDDEDGTACTRCWYRYLFYVANGRRYNPYKVQVED